MPLWNPVWARTRALHVNWGFHTSGLRGFPYMGFPHTSKTKISLYLQKSCCDGFIRMLCRLYYSDLNSEIHKETWFDLPYSEPVTQVTYLVIVNGTALIPTDVTDMMNEMGDDVIDDIMSHSPFKGEVAPRSGQVSSFCNSFKKFALFTFLNGW